jgi:uncharacterized protein DUF2589
MSDHPVSAEGDDSRIEGASGAGAKGTLKTGDAAAPDFPSELASMDFDQIIGGPLCAAIAAQAQAANLTASFIESVGLQKKGQGLEAVEVSFSYSRNDDKGKATAQSLTVPLLSIIPIPFIRVQTLDIDLNVKLTSVQKQDTKNELTASSTVSSDGGFLNFFSPVKFTATVTDKNVTSSEQTVDRSYNLNVKLHAVQDAMPGGLSRVLEILQGAIGPTTAEKTGG